MEEGSQDLFGAF